MNMRTTMSVSTTMNAEKILTLKNIRPTQARRQILELLYREACPLTAGEIIALQKGKAADRVTIYRTLYTLAECGLVHQVQGLDGAWRFCAHPPAKHGCPGNHPHFLCRECGRMICLTEQKLPWVEVPADVEVKGKQLVIYGSCSSCARKKKRGNRKTNN